MPNTPVKVRFYVKYDTNEPPPRLVEWRLNAKTVCPDGVVTESYNTEMYFTSPELVLTTLRPSHPPPQPQPQLELENGNTMNIGDYFRPQEVSNEEDDFFEGDFALLGKPKPSKPILDEQCGVVVKAAQPLITYGQPTEEGQFPWHVALYHARGIDLTYICGGSLISSNHIITVAHCVTRRKTQSALSPSTLMVYLGKYYLKVWSNPGIQDRQIEKIIVHQRYNSHTFSNDIAILKLNQPADITDFVRPVCLWNELNHLESVIAKQGTVVGWGFDQNGKVTEQLTQAHMPVVSQETCIYSFPEFYSRFTSDHTYCAGFNNGTSVCNGDSGGGMVFPRRGSDPHNPIWQIRGMVSISVALQNQFKCDSSHYVVFTDIAKYLDWIKNALQL
ncbi:unnamed protein product [Psylliodes chrysocephalus]|nr:unnamed protein product [Psylliodes chrysocephala]